MTHQLENLTLMGLLGRKEERSGTIASPIRPALASAYSTSNWLAEAEESLNTSRAEAMSSQSDLDMT